MNSRFRLAIALAALLNLAQPRAAFAQSILPPSAPASYSRFAEWKAACDQLPFNRALKGVLPPRRRLPLPTFDQFTAPIDAAMAQAREGPLAKPEHWLNSAKPSPEFFDLKSAYFLTPKVPFQPFAQKLVVPPEAQVLFHGDLHGDIHSLNAWLAWLNEHGYLRDFRLAKPNTWLVMLGDYTDRGLYGAEVLYTVLRLKLENPDRVILVRGNHEDANLAARYGFLAELTAKYGRNIDLVRVLRLYDFFPVVLYLGSGNTFIQCNHGGLEPGFDPGGLLDSADTIQFELIRELKQAEFVRRHQESLSLADPVRAVVQSTLKDFVPLTPTTPSVLGFMWNDFSFVRNQPEFAVDPDRAYIYGENLTRFVLEQAGTSKRPVHAIFRAHQHSGTLNPMMRRLKASRGVFRHWQTTDSQDQLHADPASLAQRLESNDERPIPPSSVWTFNVAPDSVYGEACDFGFDTFGILTTAANIQNWRLRIINLTVVK